MIRSVLIANRGEIARRIIRTARRLGIRTVAVYSEADTGAPHVREADDAALVGPAPPRESYLKSETILEVAKAFDAEAIHPGYGFLSENADFAEAVVAAGRIWVGPPASAIRSMGLKDAAKRLMAAAGVPVTPGYLGDDQDPATLAREAHAIGWPVLIKAVSGGGGKGMRKVESASDFASALAGAQREAASAFGDQRVLIEKYIARPRHIEVQVFGDAHGHVVHLFERDCSLQRRHQKVIEEAPAPGMDQVTRATLCASAVRAAEAVGYQGAGTVEFIADASEGLRADRIWFMEMNTRLQVEHPVTEAITGLDLVEWQFRVASGEPLPLAQDQIFMSGHAMEARLYAEDPASGFLPSTGALSVFHLPAGIRSDSAVEQGGIVTPYYDPLLAKLISHEGTRESAAATLANACASVRAWPVKTNAWFLARCLSDADFARGEVDTHFIDSRSKSLVAEPDPSPETVAAAAASFAIHAWPTRIGDARAIPEPWSRGVFGFRMNRAPGSAMIFYDRGARMQVMLSPGPLGALSVSTVAGEASVTDQESHFDVDGMAVWIRDGGRGEVVAFCGGAAFAFSRSSPAVGEAAAGMDGAVRSPMPGRIVALAAKVGDRVLKGHALVTLEAMKMEHALKAPFDGLVVEVAAGLGQQVSEGVALIRLEAG